MENEKMDWQDLVWKAKEQIYRETKNMNFKEYLAYIKEGANRWLTRNGLKKEPLSNGDYKIVREK